MPTTVGRSGIILMGICWTSTRVYRLAARCGRGPVTVRLCRSRPVWARRENRLDHFREKPCRMPYLAADRGRWVLRV